MTIMEAIRAHLLATQAVTDLVGTRVHYNERPQNGGLPALAFRLIGNPKVRTFGGGNSDWPRVQIDVFAATSLQAQQLAQVVTSTLDWFGGTLGGVGGVAVENIEHIGEVDLSGDPRQPRHIALDFKILHERA